MTTAGRCYLCCKAVMFSFGEGNSYFPIHIPMQSSYSSYTLYMQNA